MLPGRFNQIGANLFWLVVSRLVRIVTGLVVLGFVSRYLGVEQFGVLNYAIGLTAIFSTVASLGFEGIVVRELVNAPARTNAILGTAFILRMAGGIAAIGLVGLTALLTVSDLGTAGLSLIVATAFLPGAFDVIELWFQKHIQAKHMVLARVIAALLVSAIKIGLVFGGARLVVFAWAQVLEAALGAVALVWVFQGRGQRVKEWAFDRNLCRVVLRDSWPLILSGLLVAVYMRIEQIMVMTVLGDYSMGIYSASVKVTEMWAFIPSLILVTIYPILVAKRQENAAAYKQKLQTVFDLMTGLGYGVAVGTSLLAPFIIPLIYGKKYDDAIGVLLIQVWTAPITFSASVRAQYFLLENKTIYHTFAALIGIVANVALALWLMRFLGARGAACAVVVASWMAGHLSSLIFGELRECAIMQTKAFCLPFRLPTFLHALKQLR
jgi:PST family polysaccharide transporter